MWRTPILTTLMNTEQPAGNFVEIDHGHGEFSMLAHLKQASVTVAPGDRVGTGDVIGLCGNSGNSSEPMQGMSVEGK
ncbi:M23 family metallopeptidase [Brevibacillus sp. NRS-1366]|uniref:M23 family metallopeptidase n=1 Tax=Brevibacillus sp. NRS-1366 TaxID=3233899 RepID=UPI003D263DF1